MNKLSWALAIGLIVYTILRAVNITFTCDECITYGQFVFASVTDIVTYQYPIANNHILNSLLVKFIVKFANSEVALRLPNILALVLYLYSGIRISKLLFTNKVLQFLAFAIFCMNPML